MADIFTKEKRSMIMSAIGAKDTVPEILLRKALWRLGLRYRKNDKRYPGKPDMIFPKYKKAVLIHGCFWHGHHNCARYKPPASNTSYWSEKIKRNKQRDRETITKLNEKGILVLTVWECTVKNKISFDKLVRHVHSWLLSSQRNKEV